MGFPRPRIAETRGRIPRPLRGPKTSGTLSRVSPPPAPQAAIKHSTRGVRQRTLLRRVLRRVLETACEKVLRRVLRRCLAVGFNGKSGSEKGF